MAPRRTAAKTAVVEASEFNFDEFLAGFERPKFTRSLFRKGKLGPELRRIESELDDMDAKIDRLERAQGEDGSERDITAVDPLSELEWRREALTVRYNAMAEEFNASAVPFTFRVPDKRTDQARIQEMMREGGFAQPDAPDTEGMDDDAKAAAMAAFDVEFNVWWDALAVRSMSVTCESHSLTIDQWESLRDVVGEVAFAALCAAWFEAVQAAAPSAPFSLRRSHSPETVE